MDKFFQKILFAGKDGVVFWDLNFGDSGNEQTNLRNKTLRKTRKLPFPAGQKGEFPAKNV